MTDGCFDGDDDRLECEHNFSHFPFTLAGYAKLACSPLEKVAAHKNLFDAQDACETTPGCEAVGSVDRDAIWHFFPCATFAQTTNSQFTLIATRIKE